MSLSRREQILFAVAALLAAAFLAYAFAILPAVERYRHQGVLIEERTRRAAIIENKLKHADALEQRYRASRARIAQDRGRSVSNQSLFANLQALASPMGIHVTGVSPLPPKEQTYYRELSVLIDIESDLEALVHFLLEIEREDTRLRVQRLVIAPLEPGNPQLRCQVQAATRVFHEEAKKP